ncbi:hypothetical protein [Bordetella genomosp. 9]|uniref:hypothetical protein n=1 Tax=Bordetella genomosp. 9 TaxID=1416803 RepID=UPI0015C692DA|nr:hypothetical protein [Bordetella genomosp. 9]
MTANGFCARICRHVILRGKSAALFMTFASNHRLGGSAARFYFYGFPMPLAEEGLRAD